MAKHTAYTPDVRQDGRFLARRWIADLAGEMASHAFGRVCDAEVAWIGGQLGYDELMRRRGQHSAALDLYRQLLDEAA